MGAVESPGDSGAIRCQPPAERPGS
jgi:hypothetical protein